MKYKIIRREDGRYAIFDENGNMISPEWFDYVDSCGLVKGQSSLYLARKDEEWEMFDVYGNLISKERNSKWAIFDKDGNQITDWFDYIYEYGLLRGECDYYISCNGEECAVYHKNGQKVSDDFPEEYVMQSEKVVFNENLGILEMTDYDGNINAIHFNPVYPFKEEIIDYTKLLNI
jgi:hypothetical protein